MSRTIHTRPDVQIVAAAASAKFRAPDYEARYRQLDRKLSKGIPLAAYAFVSVRRAVR